MKEEVLTFVILCCSGPGLGHLDSRRFFLSTAVSGEGLPSRYCEISFVALGSLRGVGDGLRVGATLIVGLLLRRLGCMTSCES